MWFLLRRTLLVVLVVCMPLSVCARDVGYGPFFKVLGVTQEQDRLVLPLTRGKYANVRILDGKTYRWLLSCTETLCQQPDAKGNIEVQSVRGAQTRPGMWIAQVAVDQRWLLTFLVFQNPKGYGVVAPDTIVITQPSWYERLEQEVTGQVDRFVKEGNDAM